MRDKRGVFLLRSCTFVQQAHRYTEAQRWETSRNVRDCELTTRLAVRKTERVVSDHKHETRVSNQRRFVITGGPGTGKTTMIRELEQMGFACMPEVARQIIQEQVRIGGTALPWSDRREYARLMLLRSIESYQQTPPMQTTFADRGIPDTLGYARLIALDDDREIREACARYRYASLVFVTPPWEKIYEIDSERKQDFEEVVRTFHFLTRTYEECGYSLVEVPQASPKERALFILDHLGLRKAESV